MTARGGRWKVRFRPSRWALRSWVAVMVLALSLAPAGCDSATAPGLRAEPTSAATAARPSAAEPALAARPDVEYVEMLTPSAEATKPLPLVVAIHGLGDDPARFANLMRPLTAPARVVLPRGLERYHDGWSWFPFSRGDVNRSAAGMRTAAERLAALLTWLVKNRRTIGKPVVTGFSQGGMLTFALAVRHPEVVGSAYPMSGVLPEPLWPDQKAPGRQYPPIVAFHGATDPLIAMEPTQRGVDRLRELGFSAELRAYEGVGHSVSADMQADLVARLDADCRAIQAHGR